jgi:hypothetical protein
MKGRPDGVMSLAGQDSGKSRQINKNPLNSSVSTGSVGSEKESNAH